MASRRATATERPESPRDQAAPPPHDDLQARLLDHTLRVLLRDGYQRFSMSAVAASAKASKETLYRHFGDKTGLLHAALVRSAELIGPILHEGLDGAPTPTERLRRLGLNYLRGCYLPEALALRRIAYAGGEHGLGPVFVTVITDRAIAYVEEEFASLGSDRPRADAETFLGMIQGKLLERTMLGVTVRDLDRQMHAQLDQALRVIEPYLDTLHPAPG